MLSLLHLKVTNICTSNFNLYKFFLYKISFIIYTQFFYKISLIIDLHYRNRKRGNTVIDSGYGYENCNCQTLRFQSYGGCYDFMFGLMSRIAMYALFAGRGCEASKCPNGELGLFVIGLRLK